MGPDSTRRIPFLEPPTRYETLLTLKTEAPSGISAN